LQKGAQAVAVLQQPLTQPDALGFLQEFYVTLIQTGVIDLAMREARRSLYRPDDWTWTNPVLSMRTRDAQLFQPLPEKLESNVKRSLW
jgi:hypothetical protein